MKKIYKLLTMVLICGLTLLIAQSFNINSAKKTKNIVSKIWFHFGEADKEKGWEVRTSKYGVEDKTKSAIYDVAPEALGDDRNNSSRSFGFQTAFKRKGYNYVDVFRPSEEEKPFPGVVDNMSIWVWGGNFDYNMEVHLEDYQGYIYRLPMGNLKFYGWQNLVTKVPSSVKQVEPHAPKKERLKFKKFRLYAQPYERANKFICLFDYFKIVTDTYVSQYDGLEVERLLLSDSVADRQSATATSTGIGEN